MAAELLMTVDITSDSNNTRQAPANTTVVSFDARGGGGTGGDANVELSRCGGGGGGGARALRFFACSPNDVVSWDVVNGQIAVNVFHDSIYKGCAASRGGDGTYLQRGYGGQAQGDASDHPLPDKTHSGGSGAEGSGSGALLGAWGGGGGGNAKEDQNGAIASGSTGAGGGGNGGVTATNVAAQPPDGALGGGGGGGGAMGDDKTGKPGSHPLLRIQFWRY